MSQGTCAGCGAALPPLRNRGNPRKWCSEKCRVKASHLRDKQQGVDRRVRRCTIHVSTCEVCGHLWSGRKRGRAPRTCSRTCALEWNARAQRKRYAADPESEKVRIASFRLSMSDEQREAERERQRAWVARHGGRATVGAAADHMRRARKAGAYAERFSPAEIYERDGWICGICDVEIDRELKYPDPMSVSLDHVTPLSLGGPHTRANTRPAHLECNVRRGNRVDLAALAS